MPFMDVGCCWEVWSEDPPGACTGSDDELVLEVSDAWRCFDSDEPVVPVFVGSKSAVVGVLEWILLPPTSRSGKVMKKRQPKVVPKKAPSTLWKRELGGV